MSMKYPLTSAGIEVAIFQFVAQHINHCATAGPFRDGKHKKKLLKLILSIYKCVTYYGIHLTIASGDVK